MHDLASATVVIPTRNRLSLLREAIQSVVDQSMEQWRLIVVDDASSDGTGEWLATLDDRRIRAVHLEVPSERSVARNRGLELATTEMVLFLDDDDQLLPGALRYLRGGLTRHPSCVAFVGGVEVFSETGTYRGAGLRREIVLHPWREAIGGWCAVVGQAAFRTQPLRSIGGFEAGTEPSEDQALWLRLGRERIAIGRRRVLRLRSHPGQGSAVHEDLTAHQMAIRERAVGTLPESDREPARRAIAYWLEWRQAQAAYAAGDGPSFRRHIRAALRVDPELVASPLMRAGLGRKVVKSFLPRGMLWTLRRLRTRIGLGVVR